MSPDYPHKIFLDFRNHFFLLMETLAMDVRRALSFELRAVTLVQ